MNTDPKYVAFEEAVMVVPFGMTHANFALPMTSKYGKPVSAGFFYIVEHNGLFIPVIHGESSSLGLASDKAYTMMLARNINSTSTNPDALRKAVAEVLQRISDAQKN